MLKYRQFGKHNHNVSEMGMGTWGMGGMWGPRDDRGAIDALVYAMEHGINFFDTALAYGRGHSEELIASATKIFRKPVLIATKIPPLNHRWPGKADYKIAETFPKHHIRECTEASLKNLRAESVFLQQLHVWHDDWLMDGDWDDSLDEILKLKEEGKILHFGVSINDHAPQTALKLVSSGLIDSVQVIFNIFDQSPLAELMPLCQQKNVAVIVRVPFDEGSLTGKINTTTQFHKNDWRSYYFTPERLHEVEARVKNLQHFINDETPTLAQVALKFCLSFDAVTTVIPGMRQLPHIDQALQVSKGKYYQKPELDEFAKQAWLRNFYPFQ